MKKLGLLMMPIMAISILASCDKGGDIPEPVPTIEYTLKINLTDCKIGSRPFYTKEYAAGETVKDITVTPDSGFILTDNSIGDAYKSYWKESTGGTYVFSGLTMDKSYEIDINASNAYLLKINLIGCKVSGRTSYTQEYAPGEIIKDVTVTPDSGFALTDNSIGDAYKSYWKKSTDGTYVFSGLTMDKSYTIDINASSIYTLKINLTNCKIDGETSYTQEYIAGETIKDVTVTPDSGFILTNNSIGDAYKSYWKESTGGTYVFSGLTMDKSYEIDINASSIYTLKINLTNCKIDGETSYTQEYIAGETIKDVTVTPDSGFILTNNSIGDAYKSYWKESTGGTYVFSGLTMDKSYTIDINASNAYLLKINLIGCKVSGGTSYTQEYAPGETIKDVTVTPDSGLILADSSVDATYKSYWKESTGGTYVFSGLTMDKSYTIDIYAGYTIVVDSPLSVAISPSFVPKNKDYVGTITIDTEAITDKVLPESPADIVLDDGVSNTSIKDKCKYTLQSGRKSAELKILAKDVTVVSNIKITLSLIDELDMWYKKTNWWEYCSNNVENQQATSADIGLEVEVEVNTLKHKVRLLGIDHDDIATTNSKAHCTFEFSNLITNSQGSAIKTTWDETTTVCYNFPESDINKFLNGDVFDMLPSGLRAESVIKKVDKKVAIGDSYTVQSYQTKLFPLSYYEFSGEKDTHSVNEGNKYAFLHARGKRTKTPVGSSSPNEYWLRSPQVDAKFKAWSLNTNGTLIGRSVRLDAGIAPAFCI